MSDDEKRECALAPDEPDWEEAGQDVKKDEEKDDAEKTQVPKVKEREKAAVSAETPCQAGAREEKEESVNPNEPVGDDTRERVAPPPWQRASAAEEWPEDRVYSEEDFVTKWYMCEYYPKGQCTRGTHCSWAHDESEIGQKGPNAQKVKCTLCHFFTRGHCRYGEECTYAHGEAELGTKKPEKGKGKRRGRSVRSGTASVRLQPGPESRTSSAVRSNDRRQSPERRTEHAQRARSNDRRENRGGGRQSERHRRSRRRSRSRRSSPPVRGFHHYSNFLSLSIQMTRPYQQNSNAPSLAS